MREKRERWGRERERTERQADTSRQTDIRPEASQEIVLLMPHVMSVNVLFFSSKIGFEFTKILCVCILVFFSSLLPFLGYILFNSLGINCN